MRECTTPPLTVIDLGRRDYQGALSVQQATHERVLAGELPGAVILVEHDPVITVSRRKTAVQHLLASPARLAELRIDVQETDRGGDITYHGPGQLVAYPILPLSPLGLHVGGYMRMLEQVAIDTAAAFGVAARRDPPNTGVWVERPNHPLQKLCALGVRVRRNVTLHGLALNVTTDLSHFDTIVPCGLAHRGVTSLQTLLGDRTPGMQAVKDALVAELQKQIHARVVPV